VSPEQGLFQVARCTKIIKPGTEETKYVINVKQIAKVSFAFAAAALLCLLLPFWSGVLCCQL
jgi:hypothetical protein